MAAATLAFGLAAAAPAPVPPPTPSWTATLRAEGPDALAVLKRGIRCFAREGIAVAVDWGTPGVMRPGPILEATLRATSSDRAALDQAVRAAGSGFASVAVRADDAGSGPSRGESSRTIGRPGR